MTDLDALRRVGAFYQAGIVLDAADEIERLRDENELLRLKVEEYEVCYGGGVTLEMMIEEAAKAAEEKR